MLLNNNLVTGNQQGGIGRLVLLDMVNSVNLLLGRTRHAFHLRHPFLFRWDRLFIASHSTDRLQ